MKYPFFFLAVLAASCGDYRYDNREDRVGEVRPLSQIQMSDFEVQKITRICNALKTKEQTLNGVVNLPLTFTTSQEDCERNKIPPETVSVVIQNQGDNYVFKRTENNLDFLFPTVETTSNGLLSGICGSLPNLVNPIVSGSNVTYYTTSLIDSDHCESQGLNEICINVEQATAQEDGTGAVVHTKDWLRVRTFSSDQKFIGYVTDRKKISKGFCGQDEVLIHKATLKIENEN